MSGDHNMNQKHDGVTLQYEYPLEKEMTEYQRDKNNVSYMFTGTEQPKEVMRIDRQGGQGES